VNGFRQIALSTVLVLLAAGCATTTPAPPDTWDGLERREASDRGALYVRPDLQAGAYRTVMVDPLVVSTHKDWQPVRDVATGMAVARHRVSSREIRYIEDTIDPEFRRILVKELDARGYRVVNEPHGGTLRVGAGLAFVFIDSPSVGMGRLRSDDTATLVLNISDATTGQLLARLVDTKQGGKMGMLESPNTVANNMAFRRVVRDWAGTLCDALEVVSGAPEPRGGSEPRFTR